MKNFIKPFKFSSLFDIVKSKALDLEVNLGVTGTFGKFVGPGSSAQLSEYNPVKVKSQILLNCLLILRK